MPRFNITLTEKLHSYYAERSKETGVSMSALMALDLQNYLEQKKAVAAVSNPDFIKMVNAAIEAEGAKNK